MFLCNIWPKSLFDILCDFAVAEKNYFDTNFEPSNNKTLVRKEDEVIKKYLTSNLFPFNNIYFIAE